MNIFFTSLKKNIPQKPNQKEKTKIKEMINYLKTLL